LKLQIALATIGLGLDAIGVILLFFFQVERHSGLTSEGQGVVFADEGESKARNVARWRKYSRLTSVGLLCLLAGFLIQALALWV
jgi:hypothetical protein